MFSKSFLLSTISFLGLLEAVSSAVPSCNNDNCLRAFVGSSSSASAFCALYTAPPSTPPQPPPIPAFASPCSSSAVRISSACSCIGTATTSPTSKSSSTTSSSTSPPATCPTIPPVSTITVTSVTTVTVSATATVSTCPATTSTASPCSCTNILGNPSFEDPTTAPWEIINNDPVAVVSLAPALDTSLGTVVDGNWALQFAWPNGDSPEGAVGIYQSVQVPSCCVGPTMNLQWSTLNPHNTCTFTMYNNLIYGSHTSGTLGFYESYTIEPDAKGWVTLTDTFSFETTQAFQLEIVISCTTPDTLWLDLVALGTNTAPTLTPTPAPGTDDWNTPSS